jgi:hydrogenase maturation protease
VTAWDELLVDPVPGDSQLPAPEVLVAGIGNIFLGDDGFGVEAVRQLLADRPSPLVKVADFGIRGVHLAYELLYGYGLLILIDAVPGDDPPGTVSLIEVPAGGNDLSTVAMDAHRMDPAAVLALTADLGGAVGTVVVVGCQPASVAEGIGLSDAVAAAVPTAVDLVRQLIASATGAPTREAS